MIFQIPLVIYFFFFYFWCKYVGFSLQSLVYRRCFCDLKQIYSCKAQSCKGLQVCFTYALLCSSIQVSESLNWQNRNCKTSPRSNHLHNWAWFIFFFYAIEKKFEIRGLRTQKENTGLQINKWRKPNPSSRGISPLVLTLCLTTLLISTKSLLWWQSLG